jgi:hypothetical protein
LDPHPLPRFGSLHRAPDLGLSFGAVFCDPAPIGFRECAPKSGRFEIVAVSRRPRLLPPGVVQHATFDGVEAKRVNEAEHGGLGA